MEAYFHNDPRIEEWVNQITEKVFTVCLLTGVDSESEYQRGCQIVTKVTTLLQGISTFPSEYLEDGLKQLLEQQLPDARVINNFPAFQDTMDKMLREGMSKAIDSQNREALNTLISTLENTGEHHIQDHDQNNGRSEVAPSELVQLKRNIEASVGESTPTEVEIGTPTYISGCLGIDEEFITESATPAPASVNITYPEIRKIEVEIEAPIKLNSKAYGMLRTSQVPEHADPLKRVLSNIFPNSSVCWNMNLMGQIFLAQVENILICPLDSEHPILIEDFTKEGWKVFVCSTEDLTFPRRLERGIRHIQRSGKKSHDV